MATGRKTGGRVKGTPNKATLERLERERVAEQIAEAVGNPGATKAIAKAMDAGSVWAKDELADVIPILKGIMVHFTNPPVEAAKAGKVVPKAHWDHARVWIQLFIDTLGKLAPYQSPTMRAIVVAGPDPERGNYVRFVVENAPAMIEAVAESTEAA